MKRMCIGESPFARECRFAGGVGHVYGRLKAAQLIVPRRFDRDDRRARWDLVHKSIGAELYDLCAGLGGFHVKVGQFFSGRPDLVPEQWCRALSGLCDDVAPMSSAAARSIAEAELGAGYFAEWVDRPLGSASVAVVGETAACM